jgi:hypothetical protein
MESQQQKLQLLHREKKAACRFLAHRPFAQSKIDVANLAENATDALTLIGGRVMHLGS